MINQETDRRDKLGDRLTEIFKTRAERVVFVKGDPSTWNSVGGQGDRHRARRRHRQGRSDDRQGGGWTVMRKRNLASLLAVAAVGPPGFGLQQLKSRDQLNKGVQAFKNAQYPQAVENFKTAVELDPNFPTARLYLATAYMQQYIPGRRLAREQADGAGGSRPVPESAGAGLPTTRSPWHPSPPSISTRRSGTMPSSGTRS